MKIRKAPKKAIRKVQSRSGRKLSPPKRKITKIVSPSERRKTAENVEEWVQQSAPFRIRRAWKAMPQIRKKYYSEKTESLSGLPKETKSSRIGAVKIQSQGLRLPEIHTAPEETKHRKSARGREIRAGSFQRKSINRTYFTRKQKNQRNTRKRDGQKDARKMGTVKKRKLPGHLLSAAREAEHYAWIAARKLKDAFIKNEKSEKPERGALYENPGGSYLTKIFSGLAAAYVHAVSVISMISLPVALVLVALGILLILALIVLVAILGGVIIGSMQGGLSSREDPACYLSAKYESHGDPGAIGGHGDLAYGEYQFHATAGTGLEDFIQWCYESDADTYAAFAPFLYLEHGALGGNEDFKTVWNRLASEEKVRFEADQTIFTYNNYFIPAAADLTDRYGYDFLNAPEAVQACIVSFAIRDGGYGTGSPLYRYFGGVTADSTAEEVITMAYDRMLQRRGGGHEEAPRWQDEKQDCLDLLAGELDIYEPDTSSSGYGQIDWSWKRGTASERGSRVAELALSKVGCQYSQALRDEEGYYDCSSLVYRLYREVGIDYLSGMTAAAEAQYLEENNMGISEQELQPGDLIFYSYGTNGRYKNITHVAIYVGNNQRVHAANTRRGVVLDPYAPSNIGVYARPC